MAKIVAIIGDPREKGTSRDLFQKYLAVFQEQPTIEVKIYDIRKLAFDPNLPEGYRTEQTPDIIALKNDVRSADLLLFSYPVWWFNVPAVLKGVIDHLFWPGESYSFKDKKYFSYWTLAKKTSAVDLYDWRNGNTTSTFRPPCSYCLALPIMDEWRVFGESDFN